uniref:Transmembrane protein 65 n=1 Tax=Hucho hucho TaxID=62062 RepID=A0A4W5R4L8_9TELE
MYVTKPFSSALMYGTKPFSSALRYVTKPFSSALRYVTKPFSSALRYVTKPFSSALRYVTMVFSCVSLAGYVEALACRCGLVGPDLNPKQADMWQTRVSTHSGKAIGVAIGCILGMFPLLFFKDETKKKEAEREGKDGSLTSISTDSSSSSSN